jgi:DNA-binding MarR family transcriptional regulator
MAVNAKQKKPPQRSATAPAPRKGSKRPSKADCAWVSVTRGGTNLHVEDFLTFRLTRLANSLRTSVTKRYLEQFELSLPEWRLLALVARFAPLRFSEVTARSSMDKGQVSRTLRVMAERGLTKMKTIRSASRSTEALAAPVQVSITPKGKALYQKVLPVARKAQAELLLGLNESERYALYSIIDKLYNAEPAPEQE